MTALRIGTVALLAACLHAQPADSSPPLRLVGAAKMIGTRVRLTEAVPQTVGAAWLSGKRPVSAGFEVSFRFQLTETGGLGHGADGFAFVLQNEGPDAIAGRGAAGGFALGDGYGDPSKPGIPRSVAVFFDTYRNAEAGDPSDNSISICTNGPVLHMRWPPPRLGRSRKAKSRMKDGRVHQARIVYAPPVMTVFLDNENDPEISAPVDLGTVVDSGGSAYIGFTASTGAGFENHDIVDWTFTSSDVGLFLVQSDILFLPASCLDGRNLCTPPEAVIEEKGPGLYHVVLPAHLEWGASILNPDQRPVTVEKARGSTCWALSELGAQGCGGPDGVSGDQAGLLAPGQKRGALITKTERGRTWFSINDRKGGFEDNQGFLEFEVRIQN